MYLFLEKKRVYVDYFYCVPIPQLPYFNLNFSCSSFDLLDDVLQIIELLAQQSLVRLLLACLLLEGVHVYV